MGPLGVVGAPGSAFPPAIDQMALLEGYFLPRAADHPSGPRLARAAFAASGVRRRHAAVDPRREDLATWSTGRRMARFVDLAVPVATKAVGKALERAGLAPADLGLLAVVTCTGSATPASTSWSPGPWGVRPTPDACSSAMPAAMPPSWGWGSSPSSRPRAARRSGPACSPPPPPAGSTRPSCSPGRSPTGASGWASPGGPRGGGQGGGQGGRPARPGAPVPLRPRPGHGGPSGGPPGRPSGARRRRRGPAGGALTRRALSRRALEPTGAGADGR